MLPVRSLLIYQWCRGGSSDKGQGFTGDKKGPNVPLWPGLLGVAEVGGIECMDPEYRKYWSVFSVCCERHGGLREGQVEFRAERFLTSLAQQEGQIASVSLFLPLSFHSKPQSSVCPHVHNSSSFILLSFGLL